MAVDSNKPIAFLFAGLPGGTSYCFTTPQQLALDITAGLYGYIPGQYSTVIVSESEPAVADRDKIWFKLQVGGAPTGKFFIYSGGSWISPNPEVAGSPVRRFLECSESDVWSYDGGDGTDPSSNPPSDSAGAMWQVDTNYSARMAMGAGTLPLSGTVVAVGDAGGADEVTLAIAEIPAHNHPPLSPSQYFITQRPSGNVVGAGSTPAESFESTTGDTGGGEGHQNMPPYRAGYWCKRTSRINYVA